MLRVCARWRFLMNDRNRGRGRWSDERRYASQGGGRRGDTANERGQRRETFEGSRGDRYMTDRDWSDEDRYQRDREDGSPSGGGGGYREQRWRGGEPYGGGQFRGGSQGRYGGGERYGGGDFRSDERRFGGEQYGSGRPDEDQYGQRRYGPSEYREDYGWRSFGENRPRQYGRGQFSEAQYAQGQYGQSEYPRAEYGQRYEIGRAHV